MADERANVTLTLTDEMSDKLNTITNELDGVTRRFQAIQTASTSAFNAIAQNAQALPNALRKTQESLDKMPNSIREVERSFERFVGGPIRSNIVDFASKLGGLAGQTVGLGDAAAGAASKMTELMLSFSRVGGIATALVGGLGAAAYGIYAAGERVRRMVEDVKTLQVQTGASREQIAAWGRAFEEGFAQPAERGTDLLKTLADQFAQMRQQGAASPMFQDMAARNMQLDKYNRLLQETNGEYEAAREYIRDMANLDDKRGQFARELGARVGLSKREAQELNRYLEESERHYSNPEILRQMRARNEQQERTAAAAKELRKAWDENEATILKWQAVALNALGAVLDKMTELSQKDFWPKMPQGWNDIYKFLFGERGIGQFNPNNMVRPDSPLGRLQNVQPNRGGGYDATQPLQFADMGGTKQSGGGKFVPDLAWVNQLHGDESRNIEDRRNLVETEQTSEGYLREMRDALLWMRAQMEGGGASGAGRPGGLPAAAAGGGAVPGGGGAVPGGGGGATGGFGGFGGGGFGQARTGSPWFGGAAGRGTGGDGGFAAGTASGGGALPDDPNSRSAALAYASQHLGQDEMRDTAALSRFFASQGININPATTAWCAAFVNANLNQAGIKGTGSLAAASFYKYGTPIAPNQVQAGDIAVWPHHVAFTTGGVQNGQFQVLGGNQGGTASGRGGVSLSMRSLGGGVQFRRPPGPAGGGFGSGQGAGLADQLGAGSGPLAGQSGGVLATQRAAFMQELQDPAVRQRMSALALAEVPGQQGQTALVESIFNRATARGQSLWRTMQADYYEPLRTGAYGSALRRGGAPGFDQILQSVLGGSNVANLATGNASGNVGVGQLTARIAGERFGVENQRADRAWAARTAAALRASPGGGVMPVGPHGGMMLTGLPGGGPGDVMGGGDPAAVVRGFTQLLSTLMTATGHHGVARAINEMTPVMQQQVARADASAKSAQQSSRAAVTNLQRDNASLAEEDRLEQELNRLRRGPARERARTRGAGGEGAPLGGAGDPHDRVSGADAAPLGGAAATPQQRREMQRRAREAERASRPHTRGAGGEAAPLGGAAPTADQRRRMRIRELEARQTELQQERETRARRRELEGDEPPEGESPAERLERLQQRGARRADPESEIDRQLGRTPYKPTDTADRPKGGKRLSGDGTTYDPATGKASSGGGKQVGSETHPLITSSGSTIDGSLARQQNWHRHSGRLDVHFHNSPARMRATAQGRGAFEKMKITQTPQMAKTGGDGSTGGEE